MLNNYHFQKKVPRTILLLRNNEYMKGLKVILKFSSKKIKLYKHMLFLNFYSNIKISFKK